MRLRGCCRGADAMRSAKRTRGQDDKMRMQMRNKMRSKMGSKMVSGRRHRTGGATRGTTQAVGRHNVVLVTACANKRTKRNDNAHAHAHAHAASNNSNSNRTGSQRHRKQQASKAKANPNPVDAQTQSTSTSAMDNLGLSLGPIGLTIGESKEERSFDEADFGDHGEDIPSINSQTTDEWRKLYETEGTVDLWMEDEYNAASRIPGGRSYGIGSGEGKSQAATAVHNVKIFDKHTGKTLEVEVPDDRYILFEAEDAGLDLPWACRMGCCTACAVKIKSGNVRQVQALGVSEELKQKGYALMCVSYPESDLEVELVDEDEVYDLQFGKVFASRAVDPSASSIVRDDFALELADMDE